jgi:hypothetical protein
VLGCGGSGSNSPYGSTQSNSYRSSNNNDPLGNIISGLLKYTTPEHIIYPSLVFNMAIR